MMKKTFLNGKISMTRFWMAILLILFFSFFSGCKQEKDSIMLTKYGYMPLEGVEWGMTQEEIIQALQLKEDQIIEGDGYFGFQTDAVRFGRPLSAVSFQMIADPRVNDDQTPRLSQISFSYPTSDEQTFSDIEAVLVKQLGEPEGARKIIESEKDRLQLSTQPRADRCAGWYSEQTVGSLSENTQELLKPIVLSQLAVEVKAEQDEAYGEKYWEAFQGTSLVSIKLDCRDPDTASYKSEYGELTFDGSYAYYARMLEA